MRKASRGLSGLEEEVVGTIEDLENAGIESINVDMIIDVFDTLRPSLGKREVNLKKVESALKRLEEKGYIKKEMRRDKGMVYNIR